MSQRIKDIAAQLAEPIVTRMNLELVDVEYKKEGKNWFLRVFIDGENGVDILDCEKVSEALSAKLDESDPIPGAYYLEVSSPGAERPLKTAKDIARSIGKYVYVTTYEPIDGEKAFEGTLQDFDGTILTVEVKVKGRAKTVEIPYEKVAKARLAIQF
ncbi:ribosome maturation factor RimP [Aliibacillus thermotolerans]|uniref:Ribosome maturation factor RimP n=1 Tax=Aliibacillus thermotolerans TaxID=1834418 RepID=A0ABW0U764_9BACI|nr:ribosome maturation factor RimP [Aliibacillus thermotolerans]MDA3130577.1 ribosome maturation factor RimP [Aliibacillus thermotolerans]